MRVVVVLGSWSVPIAATLLVLCTGRLFSVGPASSTHSIISYHACHPYGQINVDLTRYYYGGLEQLGSMVPTKTYQVYIYPFYLTIFGPIYHGPP